MSLGLVIFLVAWWMAHMADFLFVFAARLILGIRPVLPAICAISAWAITAMLALNIMAMLRQGAANMRQLHRIKCANCLYATDSYQLKCSVHPTEAFSEEAIACPDFANQQAPFGKTLRAFSEPIG